MERQLSRKINGETYYCEKIENSKYEAQRAAKKMKSTNGAAKTLVRIIRVSSGYGLFARTAWR